MKINFEITREDYLDLNWVHFKKTGLKKTIIAGVVAIVMMQLIIQMREFHWISMILSTLTFIGLYAFIIWRRLNKSKEIPDKDGTILGEKEIEFTEERIEFKSADSDGSSNWKTVRKFLEGSSAFYLYMDTNLAMIIPKRAFKGDQEIEEFKKLVNRKINNSQP